MNDNLGELAAALAKAQAVFPAIVRDKEVDSRSYKFKYAPLDKIIEAVRKPLSDNDLAVTQLLDGGDLVTMLLHSSGASLSGRVSLPREGTIQQFGSAVTYIRRYALQAMLGIAAEEDDDGETAAKVRTTNGQRRVDPATGEILATRQNVPQAPLTAPIAAPPSQEDIDALHERFAPIAPFTPEEIDEAITAGLSSAELFGLAEEAGITRGQLTVGAKTLFGANRWKITELSDEERLALWQEIQPAEEPV